jgi:hypothetical protein
MSYCCTNTFSVYLSFEILKINLFNKEMNPIKKYDDEFRVRVRVRVTINTQLVAKQMKMMSHQSSLYLAMPFINICVDYVSIW